MQEDLKNSELDKIIISYAIYSKHFAMELSNNISEEFFSEDLRWLYSIIMQHFLDPRFKEIPTKNIIEEYLRKNCETEYIIDNKLKIFDEISKINIEEAEFSWHLDKLKTRYNKLIQLSCVSKMQKMMSSVVPKEEDKIKNINKIIHETISEIDTIYRKEAYEEGSLKESARDRARKYKEIEANPEKASGLLTGFSELDRITNGLHGGELIIIGGSTGTGKSIILHNIAVNSYLGIHNPLDPAPSKEETFRGNNILYFSLEMPKENQERRIDACMAGIMANEIRDGKLSPENKEKYFKVLKFQDSYSKIFHVVDMPRGVTARDIELKYIEASEKYGEKFDAIFVDYLGIMKPSVEQNSDWLELGYTAEELHELARIYKVPILTATQLNRPKDPTKSQNSTDRVARSSMVPDNANIILQIGCRGDDEYTRMDMPIYITKMRDGEKGSFTLTKDFARMKVVDVVDETFSNDKDDNDDIGI